MKRAVITGAAGFIGSKLVKRLLQEGIEVIGIDNERSGDWNRVDSRCERIEVDLDEMSIEDFAASCENADGIFHLAAEKYNSSKSTPEKVLRVNIDATHRLIQGAAQVGSPKIVFTSSLYAYGSLGPSSMAENDVLTPTTMYGLSKVAGENLLRVAQRDNNQKWAVARLFFVYGPNQYAEGGYKSVIQSNFERIASGIAPTINGDGEQSLDYVFVEDVIDALLLLHKPENDGLIVNVGNGEAISINQLTDLMLEIANSDLEPDFIPPDWTDKSSRVGDMSYCHKVLGWKAKTDLREGLSQFWNWKVGL